MMLAQNRTKIVVLVAIVIIGIGLYFTNYFLQYQRSTRLSGVTVANQATPNYYYPLTSCVIDDIDVCAQPIFIRNTTERGLNYPRLHNDAPGGTFDVRAVGNGSDVNTQWKLKRLENGNFQIISLANNEALRMILDPGEKYPVSCNPQLIYDLKKKGADGICAEFTIIGMKVNGMNSNRLIYMIAIPNGYTIQAKYRNGDEQIVSYGTIGSLICGDVVKNSALDINFRSNSWAFFWSFERV